MHVGEAGFIFYCDDVKRARDFYAAVLQKVPRLDVDGMVEFQLTPHAVLGLMPTAGIRRLLGDAIVDPASSDAPQAELYVVVDDVEAAHRRALDAGGRELSAVQPRNWGDTAGYVADLDGHVLALASRASVSSM